MIFNSEPGWESKICLVAVCGCRPVRSRRGNNESDRVQEGLTEWPVSQIQCGEVQQEKCKDLLFGSSESQISMRRCTRNNKNMERHSARRCDRVGASLTITM